MVGPWKLFLALDTQGQERSDFFLDHPAHGHLVGGVPAHTASLSLSGQTVPIRCLNLKQQRIDEFWFNDQKVRPDCMISPLTEELYHVRTIKGYSLAVRTIIT